MRGYITFWSREYVKHIYPVAIKEKTLCVMARLPIEKIEPAYDYLMREMGSHYSALIPEGVLIKSQGPYGEFNSFKGGCGYTDKIELPSHIHTIVYEEKLVQRPHNFHQEPITCCADIAASGNNGSSIQARLIPLEIASTFLFGKTKSTQKPLRLDKNGGISSISLSGFVRKMSDETFGCFEKMFT